MNDEGYRKKIYTIIFGQKTNIETIRKIEANFNKQNFERLLLKTPLEDYTEQLWNFGCTQFLFKQNNLKYNTTKYKKEKRKKIKQDLQLLKALYLTLTSEHTEHTVKISVHNNTKTVSSCHTEDNIKLQKEILIPIIKAKKLNNTECSYEEAKHILENRLNEDWINDYIEEIEENYDKNSPLLNLHIDNYGQLIINEDVIESYISDNSFIYDLTDPKNIEYLISLWETEYDRHKPKKGRAPQHLWNSITLNKLVFLIKTYEYTPLLNKKSIKELFNSYPTNEEFRLIYDFFVFFNLIDKQNKSDFQQLKSIYKSYQQKNKNSLAIERATLIDFFTKLDFAIQTEIDKRTGK